MTGAAVPLTSPGIRRTGPAALRVIRADAFRSAALADADMRRAVEALEPLCADGLDGTGLYRLLEGLDAAAGAAFDDALLPVLNQVRDRVVGVLCRTVTDTVRTAHAAGPDAELRAWLDCCAASVVNFREPVTRHLLALPAPLACPDPPGAARLTRWVDDLYGLRWTGIQLLLRHLLDAQRHSPSVRAELLLSACGTALVRGDAESARRCCDQAVAVAPEEDRTWECLGVYRLRAQRDFGGAEEAFRRSLDLCPERSNGHRRLGEVAEERGDLDEAERRYLRAMAERPYDAEGPLSLIELYGRPALYGRRAGRLETLAAQAEAIWPAGRYDSLVTVAVAHRDNGHNDEARRRLRAAVYLSPERHEARQHLAELYRYEHELDRAERENRLLLRQDPAFWIAVLQLARIDEERKEWDRAVAKYERILPHCLPPAREIVLSDVARAQLAAGRPERAVDVALEGLRLFPGSAHLLDAADAIARGLLAGDGAEAAEQVLRRVRDLHGPAFEGRYQASRGRLHRGAGDVPAAVAAYERAIAADRTNADRYQDAGDAYADAQDWDRARAAMEWAHELDQDDHRYHRGLGALLNLEANQACEQGRYDDAAEGYRKALVHLPDDGVIHSNLAFALEQGMRAGTRGAALREAVTAITRACELSDDLEYRTRRARLERLAELVRAHGELIATPATTGLVVIDVSDTLVPQVNPAENGSTFMYEDVPATRERLGGITGTTVPGFRFREGFALGPGDFVVRVRGDEVARGSAADAGALLEQVERVLRRYAWQLVDDEQADAWLASADVPALGPAARLIAVRVLRAVVRDGIPLTELVAREVRDAGNLERAAGETVRRIRRAGRTNLPGNAPGTVHVPVPAGPVDVAAAPAVTPGEEHRLATELHRALGPVARTVFVTPDARLRPWLQRFTEGAIGPRQDRCAGVLERAEEVEPGESARAEGRTGHDA